MLATEQRVVVDDPWNCIRVFRRLEVGPVRIEPQRVVATYKLTTESGASSIDFVYRYEQAVFDPADPAARNLGSMITAQLALNYGLFTDEIRFDGLFDETDRQLLREMAENTAREITVKKFLEHNPFLLGPAASLPVTRRDKHCWARLSFVDSTRPADKLVRAKIQPWGEHESGHAVLSSRSSVCLVSASNAVRATRFHESAIG
jgi:hypothetical protein